MRTPPAGELEIPGAPPGAMVPVSRVPEGRRCHRVVLGERAPGRLRDFPAGSPEGPCAQLPSFPGDAT